MIYNVRFYDGLGAEWSVTCNSRGEVDDLLAKHRPWKYVITTVDTTKSIDEKLHDEMIRDGFHISTPDEMKRYGRFLTPQADTECSEHRPETQPEQT